MKRLCLFILFASLVTALPVEAKFLKTSSFVYQNTNDLGIKVIISDNGIFILDGPDMDLQQFTPEKVKESKNTVHAFIALDSNGNRYSELLTAPFGQNADRYAIKGNFTLNLGKNLRIIVDNTNPYCSIVYTSDNKDVKPDILGIVGNRPIVNGSGPFMVALFGATQFNRYRGLIEPYEVNQKGLFLKGQKLTLKSIGLDLDRGRNRCIEDNAILLFESELNALRKIKDKEQRRNRLNKLSKENQEKISKLLFLRVDEKATVGLNIPEEEAYVIRRYIPKGQVITEDSSRLCTIAKVEL